MRNHYEVSSGIQALIVNYVQEQNAENLTKIFNEFGLQSNITANELKNIAIDEFRKELSNLATKEEVSNLRDEVSQIRFEMSKFATKDKLEVIKAELEKNLGDKISDTKDKLIKWVIGVGVSAAIISISSSWILFTFLIDKLSK